MTERKRYRAVAEREPGDEYWSFQVDGIDDAFGDSRRLDQVARDAADVIELALDLPDGTIDPDQIEVDPVVPAAVRLVAEARAALEQCQRETQELLERTVRDMHDQGYPYRDIGQLVGISFQRAQQLVTAARAIIESAEPDSDAAARAERTRAARARKVAASKKRVKVR
jgi:DNA-directed RNA polymerase specialized sigma24 family protein